MFAIVLSSRVEEDSVLVVSIVGTSVTIICVATEETFTVTGIEIACPTVRFTFCWTIVEKPLLLIVSV